MSEDKKRDSEKQGETDAGPMKMGMGMGKKMMENMGKPGFDPMAMKKKMMAKMSSKEEQKAGNPMMQMCKQMLGTIKQTNDKVVQATPELHNMFEEWLGVLEADAMAYLAEHPETEVEGLAVALNINTQSAVYLVSRLRLEGKITLACHVPVHKSTGESSKVRKPKESK